MDSMACAHRLTCSSQPFCVASHPSLDVLAMGLVSGDVEFHTTAPGSATTLLKRAKRHVKGGSGVRGLAFAPSGEHVFTAGGDGTLRACRASGRVSWQAAPPPKDGGDKPDPIACVHCVSEHVVAAGDDGGAISVWDTRTAESVMWYAPHSDFVAAMAVGGQLAHDDDDDRTSGTLLCAGGDGRLSAIDLRKGKLAGISDEQEDELMSVAVLKHSKKVVCGTEGGVLALWSWGRWEDLDDRMTGHPHSIDALLQVDESTLLTGSSDGVLRVVQVHPNKLLGALGGGAGGEDAPVEGMCWSHNRRTVATVSHDEVVRIWDSSELADDEDEDEDEDDSGGDDEDEGEDEGMSGDGSGSGSDSDASDATMGQGAAAAAGADSDDSDSDSDSDSDDSDGEETKRFALPTAAERFFSDL